MLLFCPSTSNPSSAARRIKTQNRFGGLRVVGTLGADYIYPSLGSQDTPPSRPDATLPLAGAFRELLQTDPKTGKQFWV
jgi:hypothetical protein